jgi:hypothetical protein
MVYSEQNRDAISFDKNNTRQAFHAALTFFSRAGIRGCGFAQTRKMTKVTLRRFSHAKVLKNL